MMTDCATLNDLINVIATPCPTLLCISTSLYTGAYLSAFRRTSYYQFSGGKTGIHNDIFRCEASLYVGMSLRTSVRSQF